MTDHTRTKKIGGDSIIFVVIQVERETIMTTYNKNQELNSRLGKKIIKKDLNANLNYFKKLDTRTCKKTKQIAKK